VIAFRRVEAGDAAAFRALRLEALRDHPADFGSDWETERELPLAHFAGQLEGNHVMGAFEDGALLGIVGILFHSKVKERHRAYLWGVYVGPLGRGRGVAGPLLDAALAVAFGRVMQVELNVRTGNAPAEALYRSRGFVACGGIPGIHLVDGVLYDDTMMTKRRNDGGT
jgi:ribosomal protein S18 acetylase RimI-like enzyme